LDEEIFGIVEEILNKGYQIDPKALNLLIINKERINIKGIIKEFIDKDKIFTKNIIKENDVKKILKNLGENIYNQEVSELKFDDIKFEIMNDPTNKIMPIEGMKGFKKLFESRYNKLMKIMRKRIEFNQIQKNSYIKFNKHGNKYKVGGLVISKNIRKKMTSLTIDDDTGKLDLLLINEKIGNKLNEILLDSLVAAKCYANKRGNLILEDIYFPDIPDHAPNLLSKKVYVAMLSDIHIGSKTFLENSFKRFIEWVKNKKDIAKYLKYIIICGDAVDGIGIYPGQEKDLLHLDLRLQYSILVKYLKQIPKNIHIFVSPGNHDPVRQSLPQPAIPKKFAFELYNMKNVSMIGNPSWIKINNVKILVYHGNSIEDIIATTPGLSADRPALAMKIMLKLRHLAPIYGRRTLLSPESEDMLVIDDVPDIFHCGHMHVLDSDRYRNVLLLNSGTWQSQTDFQANMGIIPNPGITTLVDLSTLEVITRNFNDNFN